MGDVSSAVLLLSISLSIHSLPSPFPDADSFHPTSNFRPASNFPLEQLGGRKEGRKIVRLRQKLSESGESQDHSKAARVTSENLRNFQPHFEDLEPLKKEVEIVTVEETDKEGKEVTEGLTNIETTEIYETELDLMSNEIITEEFVEAKSDASRVEKSLVGSFPFIEQQLGDNSQHQGSRNHGQGQNEHGHHDQGHHEHGHHGQGHHGQRDHGQLQDHETLQGQNQYSERDQYGDQFLYQEPSNDLSKRFELIHGLALEGGEEEVKDGRRCINKVMMIEETEYDEVLTCDHSYDNRCHTSYVTKYEPHQEEDCEEKFKKTCYIDYEEKAYAETVQVCITPWVKDCTNLTSVRDICQTVYQSECFTRQTVHEVVDDVAKCETVDEEKCENVTEGYTTALKCEKWPKEVCTLTKQAVKKYTPDTSCQKVPRKMCVPSTCGIIEGPVQCRDKVQTVVVDNPVEECDMEPIRTCKHVTKLVPHLVATQECVDVPKEICARSKINPRRVQKPAVQKWCYTIEPDTQPPTATPPPASGCRNNSDCNPGYICTTGGECTALPGKVLLNSITLRTEECTDCTEEGVILTLLGERIAGVPEGVPCTTDLLDHPDIRDFGTGQSAVWEETFPQQMGGCYEAPLNAMVRDGGSLKWEGTGTWKPKSVCVDWKSTNAVYECNVVAVTPNTTAAGEEERITDWSLVSCQDLFPQQAC